MAGSRYSRDGGHGRSGAWHACSVCLTGDSGPMGDAYIWSVLFLMATPYAVMGCVGACLVYKHRRRASAKEKRVEGEPPLAQLNWHGRRMEDE